MASKSRVGSDKLVVTDLTDFLELTDSIRSDWEFEEDDVCRPWFRGHQRKHWELVPSIVRLDCYDRESEDNIREEFATRAPALSRFEPLPINDWDMYFLMQHYGAPTRLLDWTESSTIALYFAVRDNPGYYDSAVWMLDPYELNRMVVKKNEVISPSAQGVSKRDAVRVAPWLPERWSKKAIPDLPLAIFPTHIARRISSQRACFTIHGSKPRGFSNFKAKSKSCLRRIVIPGLAVRSIRRSLENSGIDDTTIFPDLEGLGRSLATSYRNLKEESPHGGVYVRIRPSKLHNSGVGVFAIKRIPKNVKIFRDENEEVLWIDKNSLPKTGALRKLYDDFAIIKGDSYGCPTSFNRLTPAWFLNESKKPNARCDENYYFYSLREIAQGEEITVDYSTFSDYPDDSRHRKAGRLKSS
ncbi:MAG: FRG domain-containing protein [Terracidiphilus sp.]